MPRRPGTLRHASQPSAIVSASGSITGLTSTVGSIRATSPHPEGVVAPAETEHHDPLRDRDLGRRDADTSARMHRIPQILDERVQPGVSNRVTGSATRRSTG